MVSKILGFAGVVAVAVGGCGGPSVGADSQSERYVDTGAVTIEQSPIATRPGLLAQRTPQTQDVGRACAALFFYSLADVTAAQDCDSAESIVVEITKDLRDVGLPRLTKVSGNIEVHGTTTVERLRLPALRSVGGSFLVYGNAVLAVVTVGSLSTIGADVQLIGNPRFDELNFGDLRRVGGGLVIADNPGLCVDRAAVYEQRVDGAVEVFDNMKVCP